MFRCLLYRNIDIFTFNIEFHDHRSSLLLQLFNLNKVFLSNLIMSNNKKYGLIISDKTKAQQPVFQASRNVFGNDSDSENESTKKPSLLRPSVNINRQAKISQEKAVMEDPTVYQYDEVYDSMSSQKEEKKVKSKQEKKPKYIENLIKTANKRKIENERRIERQIQKEREKEGDEFADKEVFVTSSYKNKLEEMRLEEEKEKYEEYLESIGDVTKQRDLGGFYRHLYEQKLGSDKEKESKDKPKIKQTDNSNSNNEDLENALKIKSSLNKVEISKKRNYRKRKSSLDQLNGRNQLSEGELEESEEEINRFNIEEIRMAKRVKKNEENIDADSDFSIDESSDEDIKKIDKKHLNDETGINNTIIPENDSKPEFKSETKCITKEETTVETKPKIDIWKKRTVGEVFEQALKRYYERKAARGS